MMEAEKGAGDATVTLGPTSGEVVRIIVEESGRAMPMEFEPHEAEESADELRAAAERVRAAGGREVVARRAPSRTDGGRRR